MTCPKGNRGKDNQCLLGSYKPGTSTFVNGSQGRDGHSILWLTEVKAPLRSHTGQGSGPLGQVWLLLVSSCSQVEKEPPSGKMSCPSPTALSCSKDRHPGPLSLQLLMFPSIGCNEAKRKGAGQAPGSPSSRSHFAASSLSPWLTCILSLGLFLL